MRDKSTAACLTADAENWRDKPSLTKTAVNKGVASVMEKPKILIVDDRPQNLFALRQVLKGLDVDIVEATNGNNALTASLDHNFGLAILDVMMPGMDGYELATHLRGANSSLSIPIIFLSASKADEQRMFNEHNAFDIDYIVKPYLPKVLIAKVLQFLEIDQCRKEKLLHEQQLQFVTDHVPVMIAHIDKEKRYVFVNHYYAKCYDYKAKDMIGMHTRDVFGVSGFIQLEPYMDMVLEGETLDFDMAVSKSSKGITHIHLNVVPNFDESGRVQGFLAAITDITARSKVEKALSDTSASFREIVARSVDAIIVLCEEGNVEYVNASAEIIFQRSAENFVGEHFGLPLIDSEFTEVDIFRQDKAPGIGELHCVKCFWNGQAAKLIMVSDITERKQAELKMIYLAHTDPLTGLANRTLLFEQFTDELKRVKRTGKYMAVMMLDLDKFKLINDTHGHKAGDNVLVESAQRIKDSLRETDIVARLGGDEFVVVVNNIDTIEAAMAVAEKITLRMQAPFIVANNECSITASSGIAIFPKDGLTLDDLLANADAALLRGKSEGRNQFHFFDESIHQLTLEARELDKDLKIAIKEKQFVLYFQPQFDANGIIGAEALLRWNHPKRGLLYPGSFLSALSKMDFREVELWAITQGLAMAKAWQLRHQRKFYVAVNLSAPTLKDPRLPVYVNEQIEYAGLSYDSLEIEITEGMLVSNVIETSKNLTLLSEMGVGIALDDFGVGYSSMVYLLKYPQISKLKIDCEFVWEMEKNPRNLAILQSIIDLGHSLEMRIIAEGIETMRQFELLGQYGCKNFQGYLVSPAIAADNWQAQEQQWHNTIAALT